MKTAPKLQPIKDLIPISKAAQLVVPKYGRRCCRKSIRRWSVTIPGCPRVIWANGWKISRSEFVQWCARTHRLAPHVLVAG